MRADHVIQIFGTQAALAKFLGVSRAAVCYWQADGRLPELRAYQLRERRPTIDRELAALANAELAKHEAVA